MIQLFYVNVPSLHKNIRKQESKCNETRAFKPRFSDWHIFRSKANQEATRMATAEKWVMTKMFNGTPCLSNFKREEEVLRQLDQDEFRCRALVWSVDPYIRLFSTPSANQKAVMSFQLAEVIESKNSSFPVSSRVVGHFGWCTECITNGLDEYCEAYIAPEVCSLPLSATLGILGMPGITAYLGLMECCQVKEGNVVAITAAAGAVGHIACQIAKIMGCTVIAFTGTDEKVSWLKTELGLKHVWNYKKSEINDVLGKLDSKRVDCYFDNVGGAQSNTIMDYMEAGSRVCVCGSISEYNKGGSVEHFDYVKAKARKIRVRSISVFCLQHKWSSAIHCLSQWVKQGKLKYHEHAYKGFDNIPRAFIEQISGEHYGKFVIYADP
uniref:15-oxoprostaglandin 13-reductase n=1 Tax=Trichuris muris TaxID=70415 RepID=A0A5S6Q8Z2_TRIMR